MRRPFETIDDDGTPLKVVVVGAGGMGRAWLAAVEASPLVELAGIVDLDVAAALAAAASIGQPSLPTGTSAVRLASDVGARAVINVTVPAAHHPVTTECLFAGLPVLGEKPVASTVAQGLSLAAAAEATGQLFMVSQSRRYNLGLFQTKALAAYAGTAGILSAEFFKAPHFGGFREDMDHPLLLDMAIHQFDMARFLLDSEPVSVLCEAYNPSWSWFRGAASATAVFEMSGGQRFNYTGSWCSPGMETSWNAEWRLSAEHGTIAWDGEGSPTAELAPAVEAAAAWAGSVADPGREIHGSLREFVQALRCGYLPMGHVHDNIYSLAMVEAAIESAAIGARVRIDDLLASSYRSAVDAETHPAVAAVLASWAADGGFSADKALRGVPSGATQDSAA